MKRIKQFLSTTVLGGVLVILPMVVLFVSARFLYNVIVTNVRPVVHWLGLEMFSQDWMVDLLSIILLFGFCFFVGLFVRTQVGSRLFQWFEHVWLSRIPFYSGIKETIQQFTKSNNYEMMKVVLIDPFDSGSLMTGYVTDISKDLELLTVFVPTGPNPTNGLIFHVPKARVHYVDIKPEVAMKSIISVGAGSRELLDKLKKNGKDS